MTRLTCQRPYVYVCVCVCIYVYVCGSHSVGPPPYLSAPPRRAGCRPAGRLCAGGTPPQGPSRTTRAPATGRFVTMLNRHTPYMMDRTAECWADQARGWPLWACAWCAYMRTHAGWCPHTPTCSIHSACTRRTLSVHSACTHSLTQPARSLTHQQRVGVLDAGNLGQPQLLRRVHELAHSIRRLVGNPDEAHLRGLQGGNCFFVTEIGTVFSLRPART